MSLFSSPLFFKHSNIQSFLSSVTPSVWSQALQKNGEDTIEYFTLEDLWDCYEEWSAYGVGVPLLLKNGVNVTQYYAPYLSAIQIYTNNPQQSSPNLEENDQDIARAEVDTWSKKSESDKSSSPESIKGISVEEKQLGHLYLEFCDTSSPYWRIPFADKIAELAKVYPGLLTLKNVDLCPSSWISVAWYPIYHIPTMGNCKDRLSTCFLTYHTLSSSHQGVNGEEEEEEGNIDNAFYPFGLANYRLDDEFCTFDDYERIIDLYRAANSWLKQLNFWHHDFNFFTSQFSMEGLSM